MVAVFTVIAGIAAQANPAPFDLAGPNIEVTVTRNGSRLPIAQVPNLAPGDHLWIKADLPPTQSAHYLMVAAFLRGATNPPPANWFFRNETWNRRDAQGLNIVVPQDAQQLLLFMAPETGGDFKTLVNTVRGRPGAFVRASQDLNQAGLDRSRLEKYLAAIGATTRENPADLKDAAPLLARSLAIKLDDKCLDRAPEMQAACLTQNQDALILNDGHSTSIVEALTSGPANDLAMEASFTPQLSYGYYSPYIASVLDIARILDSFHTAQYQYIPALVSQHGNQLALTLNAAPSFHDPKSVLVIALPAVEQPQLPPLHAVDPKAVYCASQVSPVLAVEGAPLVFSTEFAHDLALTVSGPDGKRIELPVKAEALTGGLVVDTAALSGTAWGGGNLRGSLRGFWGFDRYEGPNFELTGAQAQRWSLAARDAGALIVGREDAVHIEAGSTSCIESVMLKDSSGKPLSLEWRVAGGNEVELQLPLQTVIPGAVTLLITQHGGGEPQSIPLRAFAEAGQRERFVLHSGDTQGLLKGNHLDEVSSLAVKGVRFVPDQSPARAGADELVMVAEDSSAAAALRPGDTPTAKVTLQDGRVFDVNALIDAPRPRVFLIGKSVQTSSGSGIQLGGPDQLPQDAKLTFSIRAVAPASFAREQTIEVAAADESFSTTLSRENGGLMQESSAVAVATLDSAKAFGASGFGPLRFRVTSNGVAGEWQPLATLVRLPVLQELKCPATPDLACKLSGAQLFLLDSVSGNAQFDRAVQVPEGFPGDSLPVPHPTDGKLYVKLRDDPQVIDVATLVAQQLPVTADDSARAEARHDAAGATDAPPPPH